MPFALVALLVPIATPGWAHAGEPTPRPPPVSDLEAKPGMRPGTAYLTWTAPEDDGHGAYDGYLVWYRYKTNWVRLEIATWPASVDRDPQLFTQQRDYVVMTTRGEQNSESSNVACTYAHPWTLLDGNPTPWYQDCRQEAPT